MSGSVARAVQPRARRPRADYGALDCTVEVAGPSTGVVGSGEHDRALASLDIGQVARQLPRSQHRPAQAGELVIHPVVAEGVADLCTRQPDAHGPLYSLPVVGVQASDLRSKRLSDQVAV